MNIEVWTDGATSKNGTAEAVGGYGFLIRTENNEVPYYCYGPVRGDKVTNNVCELGAVMLALQLIKSTGINHDNHIIVHTDSAYIANCFKDGWYVNWEANGWINSKKKPVENRVDLLARKGAKGESFKDEIPTEQNLPLVPAIIEKFKSIFARS